MVKQWAAFLKRNAACRDGYVEARAQEPTEWWKTTKRGDWMIWVMRKSGLPIEKTVWVKIAAFSGRQSLKYVNEGEHRPCLAVEAAEAWVSCPTPATQEEARVAANNARHAAAYATYAAYAAYAAAAAADAAYAAYAAYAAADATYAAYAAAAAADAFDARKTSRSNLADYIRSIIPDFDWSFLESV